MHRIGVRISLLSRHQDAWAHAPTHHGPDHCPRCGFGRGAMAGATARPTALHEGLHEPAAAPRFHCTNPAPPDTRDHRDLDRMAGESRAKFRTTGALLSTRTATWR